MRSVAQFRDWAGDRWRRSWPQWLGAPDVVSLSWPLAPPNESQALAEADAVADWAGQWRALEGTRGIEVEWVERAWSALGRQRMPRRVRATPEGVAGVLGRRAEWLRANSVAEHLRGQWPDADLSTVLPGVARRLAELDELDEVRLLDVLSWLLAHPDSGLWERELPVPHVDSKWFERHRGLVEALHAAICGTAAGLRRQPVRFRVRVLDGSLAVGPADFHVALAELAALQLRAVHVLICENDQTVSTLPELPGTVAVHGMGFAAPMLAEVPWIRGADVTYWGDLDTYGFQILGRVRAALPHIASVLMDVDTLRAHRGLAVVEPHPHRGEIGHLSLAELETLAAVRAEDLRLEQERIPASWAHPRLRGMAAVGPVSHTVGDPLGRMAP